MLKKDQKKVDTPVKYSTNAMQTKKRMNESRTVMRTGKQSSQQNIK